MQVHWIATFLLIVVTLFCCNAVNAITGFYGFNSDDVGMHRDLHVRLSWDPTEDIRDVFLLWDVTELIYFHPTDIASLHAKVTVANSTNSVLDALVDAKVTALRQQRDGEVLVPVLLSSRVCTSATQQWKWFEATWKAILGCAIVLSCVGLLIHHHFAVPPWTT